jgi:hypothetical protein
MVVIQVLAHCARIEIARLAIRNIRHVVLQRTVAYTLNKTVRLASRGRQRGASELGVVRMYKTTEAEEVTGGTEIQSTKAHMDTRFREPCMAHKSCDF